jgi:hypothetical protein
MLMLDNLRQIFDPRDENDSPASAFLEARAHRGKTSFSAWTVSRPVNAAP